MFQLLRPKSFERDVKHFLKHGGNAQRLKNALTHLQTGKELPPWFRDHVLQGKLRHCRELHVEPDWLLVYEKDGKNLRIVCLWLTSHAQLNARQRKL
jgi:mRNA interferase YafQ